MKFVVRNLRGADGNKHESVFYWCNGCGHVHNVPAERWHWNKDTELPTLSPSVRHFIPARDDQPEQTICHYHLRGGIIEYCSDCQHNLKGQKVALQEIPDDYGIPDND